MTELPTSEQWAVDVILDRRKRELEALLGQHSSDEVKRILAARRSLTHRVMATITDLLTKREEFLPDEFARDPEIAQATLDPVEEIWRHRLRMISPS
jgi:hypothetical protein